MDETIRHDEGARRFLLETPAGTAHLDYRMVAPRVMDAASTWTAPAARGAGLAGRVTRAALDHARARGWRVVASCWYVDGWLDRHPEYADLRR